YTHAHENRLFTEKCKYSAEKKRTKKAASNTQQATGRHAKKSEGTKERMGERKRAASNRQQATSRHATKKKALTREVCA
ncbi:MAG: hypothetical protein LBL13_03410, partial [Bacteroidales bacterium]|nr:hypothetical protein [Bacteroidales bacterium]